ncbi:hypothetical protein [Deinococcus fonticola]|uniref:hypothetical protein n=1 Tax=Deinococcus fonticola TaxID=2528713 RepID=UPI00142FD8AC|nr:hypothetical protein [Deinococcus fonticola]
MSGTTPYRRWCAALLLCLPALGCARACEVQSGLNLRYQATQASSGTLWVQVRCLPGEAPYRLTVLSALFQGRDWPLTLQGSQGTLKVLVRGAAPVLGDAIRPGAAQRGNQQFSFEVQAAPDQWVPAGTYSALTTLSLKTISPVEQP